MWKIFPMLIGLGLLVAAAQSPDKVQKEIIATQNAPAAIGPYSQAVRVGNAIYLSGQIAIDPATQKMSQGGIEEQTRLVLKNVQAILESAGFRMDDVVQSKVFLADLNHYGAMNQVYSEFFTQNPPARAALQVARLPLDALVEIMVTAVRTD